MQVWMVPNTKKSAFFVNIKLISTLFCYDSKLKSAEGVCKFAPMRGWANKLSILIHSTWWGTKAAVRDYLEQSKTFS